MFPNKSPWLGQLRLVDRPYQRRSRLGIPAGDLTDATFSQATSAPKAIIDFYSLSCVPCMQYKPVFEDVASGSGDDLFMATVNVDQAPQTAQAFGVESIPTTLYLENGKEVARTEGKKTKEELLADIEYNFGDVTPSQPMTVPASPPPAPPPPQVQAPSSPAPTAARPAPTAPATQPMPIAPVTAPLSTPLILGVAGVAAVGLVIFLSSQ